MKKGKPLIHVDTRDGNDGCVISIIYRDFCFGIIYWWKDSCFVVIRGCGGTEISRFSKPTYKEAIEKLERII